MLLLDTTDSKILAFLSKKTTHSSALSRALQIPRTTIAFRLTRLLKFKKVSKETIGRKTVWRIPQGRIHNKSLYKIFNEEDFLECYKIISTLPKESTIFVVQGKGAADVIFKRVPEGLIKEIHKTVKRKGIVMRAVANNEIIQAISKLDNNMKTSHIGRPQSIRLVDKLFLSSGELFITRYYVAMVNPYNKRGIIVKDPAIVILLYDFAALFFSLSASIETFDLNRYLQKTIGK